MAIVKRESLAFAARRMHELSEVEEQGQFILYVVQHIHSSGEKRLHAVVTVNINSKRKDAVKRFAAEVDEAISYMMGIKLEGRKTENAPAPEWETRTAMEQVQDYTNKMIPQGRGVKRTMLRQMWIKADHVGMLFVGSMCDANGIEYKQITGNHIVCQGDVAQMATLSQHMRGKTLSGRGLSIIKEVEIDHCVNEKDLADMLDYLGGWDTYSVTMCGRWAMIKDKATRKVSPVFSGDHFASMEWMDNMLTTARAERSMTAAVGEVRDVVELDMAPVYEMYYGMFAV